MTTRPILLAAAAGLAACTAAHAQTLTWANAAGGAASTPGNWNPAQVPGPANPLLFSLNNAYSVSFSSAVPQSFSMLFSRGVVGVSMSSPHTTGGVILGNANASSSTVNFSSGSWNSGQVTMGLVFGSAGALNCSGSSTVLDCSSLRVAEDTNLLCALNVTGSARVTASSASIGDNNPIGEGRVLVSGQTRILPVERSRLEVANSLDVGVAGIGRLRVADGALVTCRDMDVARQVNVGVLSTGSVTVGGLGLILPATLNIGGDLRISRGVLASSNAGFGAMTINDDGVVTVAGSTIIGGSGLGSGSLSVVAGGSFTTHGLTFGASGAFTFTGGSVTVLNGPFTHARSTLTLDGAAPGPTLTLDGLTNTPTFTAATDADPAVTVGQSAGGALTLANGAALRTARGKVLVGDAAGSSGALTLESGASLTIDRGANLIVGRDGAGRFTARSGARLTAGGIFVAETGGSGVVLAEGPGTVLDLAATNFHAGAQVTVRDGAVLSTNGNFGFQVPVQASASLTVDHGVVNATTDVNIDGSLTLIQGEIRADHFRSSVPITASGLISAKIVSTQPITASGDLTLGDDSIGAFNRTPLNVGAFRVTTLDADDTILGDTTINGGILLASDNLALSPNRTLSGTGTIAGNLTNEGAIVATGAAGLTFGGVVAGSGQGISGTKLTFTPGGGFTGSGNIPVKIVSQAGARITITAASTMGDGSTTGFTNDGELDITGSLTVNDSNGIGLGSLTTLRNGALSCNSAIGLGTSPTLDVLEGAGLVSAPINNAGRIRPGRASGDRTSTITLVGPYAQSSGALRGALEIEIGGPLDPDSDLLVVRNPAALAGTLDVILLSGFQPANGFSRAVVRATSISGQFETEHLPPRFHTEYTATEARVVFCSADFNNDGFVDFFDYDDFVLCFESGQCPPGASADFNQNGFADFFDYDDFVTAFEQGC